ncbi:MAG TPA: pitrilysin family protein [Longimicrobiales bacterium]
MAGGVSDVVHTKLANGAHVLIYQRAHLPLVSIALATRGGSLLESRTRAGITALMSRTSIKGTPSRTAIRIAEEAEAMGGSVSPSGGADVVDWEISVPSRHFAQAFELLCDVALHAHFPDPELEVERKLMLSDLQQTRDDMYRYPVRLCIQKAFADHPYGYTLDDVERGIASATAAELRAWRAERITSEPWVIVVGDVDPDIIVPAVEAMLPANTNAAIGVAAMSTWPARALEVVEERDKAQTAIAIGFPGPERNHEDVHALHVLANAAGGLGGRFFEELRSKRSLAYTVALMPMLRWAGGIVIGYIATTPEREAEARAGLFEQFASLQDDPLSAEEVERAKRYTIGSWQIRGQTNAAQLNDLLQAHLLGRGMSELTEFEDRIRAVDARRVQEVARRYFNPEVAVEGAVRGTGKAR